MPLFAAMKLGKFKLPVALCLAVAAALTVVGCRNLEVADKPSAGIVLPKTQMESDSIAVRVAVVELDDHQKAEFNSFIETTDQKLPLEVRQRLDQNGVRVSMVSNVNTFNLQNMLAPGIRSPEWLSGHEQELAEAGKLEPVYRMASHRHVERKRGESFNVEVSPVRPRSSWTIHIGEQQFSDSANLAQFTMRITSWPQPDGSVKLKFMPEVHHGQKLSHIGVDSSNFSVQQRREVKELRSLSFEASVLPGETVVVSPTRQLERIGDLFFNAVVDGEDEAGLLSDPTEQDVDASEFFPMIEDDTDTTELSDLIQEDQPKIGGPKPWQRFLMIRVIEVTDPALP